MARLPVWSPDDDKRASPVDSRTVDTRRSDRQPVPQPAGRPARSRVLALVAGALLALVLAGPALGHADLVSSDPEDNAVLDTPPTTITLTFSEGVAGKSSFKLLGPGGDTIGTGGPAAAGDDAMTLDGLSLVPGAYTIEWTSVADDGDIQRGKLAFTVSEPSPAPATPSAAPSETSNVPTAGAFPAPSATPAPSPSADTTPASSSGTDVLIPIIVALVLVGGIGAYLLRRNRAA